MRFIYAFEQLDEPDPDKRIIHLTAREFDIFFDYTPPWVARRALAYSEFHMPSLGRRLKRIPYQPQPASKPAMKYSPATTD